MQVTINGRDVAFEPAARMMAIDVVRQVAGLTGTKLVCGEGVCGACSIRLDGRVVTSCVLPARALEGRTVQTIEGLAGETLHPVQQAFLAADGMQCGFCTPGFVIEAAAFYDRWKREQRQGAPDRATVAEALAGHLCRCGAYNGVYEAVQRACAGEFDATDLSHGPRVEGIEKVTGRAVYTADVQLDGQLEGITVRSTEAHAIVEHIDLEAARAVDGVAAAIDLLDVDDRIVRYVGQPVAAIAAPSRSIAERAARLVGIQYRSLPSVLTIDAALAGDATAYEHRPHRTPNSSEGPIPPGRWAGNTRRTIGLSLLLSVRPRRAARIIEQARESADLHLVSGTFETADQIHTALEPHVAVARWPAVDALEVYASTQSVDLLTTELAGHFGLNRANVRVVAEHVGGAFGAKQGLQQETLTAALLSRAAGGVPVRVSNDRLEEMVCGGHRPGTRVEVDLVADRHGVFRALRMDAIGSGGVAVNSTIAVLARMFYPGPSKMLSDRDVVTNLPPGKPFRGPFGPPFFFAMESSIDDMAHRLGVDPIELRRRWDPDPIRAELYRWASTLDVWSTRRAVGADRGRFRRGVGVAMGAWVTFFYAGTTVEVSISADGISATTTTQDIGTGSRSVIAEAVAEVLRVPREAVRVAIGVSSPLPGPISSGSRTTNAVYVAATRAAQKARDTLVRAGGRIGLRHATAGAGGVAHAEGLMPWVEVAARAGAISTRGKRGANGPLDLLGRMPSGKLAVNLGRPNTSVVYVCEVEVDTRLGRIEPRKFWGGFAAGKIVAPLLARRQIEGAVVQGVGYALYEERNIDPHTGTVMNLGLEDFRIPGIGDMPEVEVHFHPGGFERLAGHAAGLSELATVPIAAAIGNAVFHATGRRYRQLPLRPARVLEGLR